MSEEIDRSTYIGGSDAAALMGKHQYKTVRDVYDKLQGNKDLDLSGNKHVQRGNEMEPLIVDWLHENLDPTINDPTIYELFDAGDASDQIFLQDDEHPFLGGHPDGIGWGDPTTYDAVVYEIKAPASSSMDRLKRHGIHARYYYQVMHYMMIINRGEFEAKRGVMVLWDYDAWKPLFVNVWYDEEKAEELYERCQDMYFSAQVGSFPDFPNISNEERHLYEGPKPMESMLQDYHQVHNKIKELKDRKADLKAKILSALDGENTIQTPNYRADVKYDWGRYDSTRLTVSER